MEFKPLGLMFDRIDRYGADSDSALFNELLYAGEFVVKTTTIAFVSALENDQTNHRYQLLHRLVRIDGLGDWARVLDGALSGMASQHVFATLFDANKTFTEKLGEGSWQYEAIHNLHEVLTGIDKDAALIPKKVALRTWFKMFAELRNKTRGHGAPTPAMCAKLVPKLQGSINEICEKNPIYKLPWAYLHRNFSGKYRVIELGGDPAPFQKLTSASAIEGENYTDGVYLWAGRYKRVELIHTDLDTSDFFLPNGAFRNERFEFHSLITDDRLKGDASPYMTADCKRPQSETEGATDLYDLHKVLTNMPDMPSGYVNRPQLEEEVSAALTNDRHPIVTLVGLGGTGKTSVALTILHEISHTSRYELIVWFSARDIDLMMDGPKPVRPHLLTNQDISTEYQKFVGYTAEEKSAKLTSTALMEKHLHHSPLGATLFVFDNFETVRNPVDLFQWIDMNIRLPNKALITTRFRDFKADYPINVSGMEPDEANALVTQTIASLGIDQLIGTKERSLVIEQSNGHPYVIKIMLGEIANDRSFSKPGKLMARREEILDVLFERSYETLSPIASRIFLTLGGWHSLVPQIAVEAVLLRHGDEGVDPELGINQLVRMALVERTKAIDGTDFLEVPTTAALFARRKLEVSPHYILIKDDIKFLQDIGATGKSDLRRGSYPKIRALFRKTARRISEGSVDSEKMRPVFELIARSYPQAWLFLSELEEEITDQSENNRAAEYVRRYLESQPSATEAEAAWNRLIMLYRSADDVLGGCGAFLKAAAITDPPLDELSKMANWLNNTPEVRIRMDVVERSALFKPLAMLMEAYLAEATATDLSRLAWLHLHYANDRRALEVANMGLERDPENTYCQRLTARLNDATH